MFTPDFLAQLGTALRIVAVDILLSADNAVAIALACRSLRPQDRGRAYVAGTVGAVAMRLLFASGIVFVLEIPFLKLLGGAALVVVAIRLVVDEAPLAAADDTDSQPHDGANAVVFWRAVVAILVGDAVMSLDNVVAVAALANGSLLLLALGLAISIPLLVFGSALLRQLLEANLVLVFLAGMALGWIAGSIACTDPAIAPWVAQQAPALAITLPAGAAAFVLWQALILRRSATMPAKLWKTDRHPPA